MIRQIEETTQAAGADKNVAGVPTTTGGVSGDGGDGGEVEQDINAILAETAAMVHGQHWFLTEEDVAYIMSSMDADNNGTLELQEWLLRGRLADRHQLDNAQGAPGLCVSCGPCGGLSLKVGAHVLRGHLFEAELPSSSTSTARPDRSPGEQLRKMMVALAANAHARNPCASRWPPWRMLRSWFAGH